MIEPADNNLFGGDSEEFRHARAKALGLRGVRPDGGGSVEMNVCDGDEWADGSVPDVALIVGGGDCFGRGSQRSVDGGSFSVRLRRFAPRKFTESWYDIFAAGKTGPVGPFGSGGDRACGANGFPFVGRNNGDEVRFGDNLSRGKLFFIERAEGDQFRTKSGGADHARLQHAEQRYITAPLSLSGDFVAHGGGGIRRADNFILSDRLGGGVARDGEGHERGGGDPLGWVGIGGRSPGGDFQVEVV